MTTLINLLSWLPGHSGFGSYVQRVVPGLVGNRLQLGADGCGVVVPEPEWIAEPPPWAPQRSMRFLQRYSLVQHGLDLSNLFAAQGFNQQDLGVIYSPFFDALLCFPRVPQIITCHDLTPLVMSNSRKAWIRYRFWQPRHLDCAHRLIAISQYVADQLVQFGASADLIVVIPNGIRILREPVEQLVTDDVLLLARHDANKNLPEFLRALAVVQREIPNWRGRIRIVGRAGRQSSLVKRLIHLLPRPSQVELLSSLSPQSLLQCLRESCALIAASTEEGFDYPVLEAKAEGIPSLISDIPVHREFHSDSSLFFSVGINNARTTGQQLASQLRLLMNDSQAWKQLSRAGVALARKHTIDRQQVLIQAQIDQVARSCC